ncbi:MAG: hypothetical protein GEU75_05345 [Dehalococcoidia bacterium]|nr:hypothetical protein [Dehalococcoidia bacterium]
MSDTKPVLHADFFSLNPSTTPQAREGLIEEARGLAELDEVVSAALIEGDAAADFDLALLFILPEFRALEPFGTDQRYTRFLQARVAPILQGLAGADVQIEDDFSGMAGYAACLAVAAPPETYDWEVKALLTDWVEALNLTPSIHMAGLAIGERQRFRGLAISSGDEPFSPPRPSKGAFGVSLITGRSRRL